jgi:hypothetical protein
VFTIWHDPVDKTSDLGGDDEYNLFELHELVGLICSLCTLLPGRVPAVKRLIVACNWLIRWDQFKCNIKSNVSRCTRAHDLIKFTAQYFWARCLQPEEGEACIAMS